MTPFEEDADAVPPGCRPTTDRLQAALDGDLPPAVLDADPHPAVCPVCRERVRAARLLLAALADPPPRPGASPGLTASILAAVKTDRRARSRRRAFALAGGLAAAAAVLVAVWVFTSPAQPKSKPRPPEVVERTPAPSPAPEPAPKPLRIGDELARAGQAIEDSTRPLTGPAAAAPKVLSAITGSLTRPGGNPAAPDLEPARQSLAEIPAAAKVGLEPVTASAQKAFSRLLRDVGAIQPGTKPKS